MLGAYKYLGKAQILPCWEHMVAVTLGEMLNMQNDKCVCVCMFYLFKLECIYCMCVACAFLQHVWVQLDIVSPGSCCIQLRNIPELQQEFFLLIIIFWTHSTDQTQGERVTDAARSILLLTTASHSLHYCKAGFFLLLESVLSKMSNFV